MDIKKIKRPSKSELKSMSKSELIRLVNDLYDIIEYLLSVQIQNNEDISRLKERIDDLETQRKARKNSQNSSKPPSTDITRPHKNKGRKGKYGPPRGHKGKSLTITEDPDIKAFIEIERCPRTGKPVKSLSKSFKRHQIIDIEPIKPIVIELQKQTTTGPDGRTIVAPPPLGLKKYKRYGPNLKTYISYLRFELNVPWLRILSFLEDTIGKRIGIGTLQSIFNELKEDLETDYDKIQKELQGSDVVGVDETGFHLNGDKWWMHLFRTEKATLFKPASSRGHEVGHSILGKDFEGILLTDFWGAYNDKFYPNAKFQKCIAAHLIRDLEYALLLEKNKGNYACQLENVFLDAVYLKKYYIFETPEFIQEREELEQRLDALLEDGIDTITEAGERLRKRCIKFRKHLFLFLYYESVPSDNNGSERDIGEFIRCRKISGGYRTEAGIESIAITKSVFSTMKKRNQKVLERVEKAFLNIMPEPG